MSQVTTESNFTVNLERELKRLVRLIRPGLIGATANANVNLEQVIDELKASPKHLAELSKALEDFLVTRDYTTALTETGLTLESGAITEVYKRLEYKILPKMVDNLDILGFLSRVFDAQSDAAWLEKIDRERFGQLLEMLLPNRDRLIEPLAQQVFLSLEILSLRLGGFGYEPLVTKRLRQRPELQHAFMDVTKHVHALLEGKGEAAIPDIQEALDRCAQAVRWVRSRRSIDGASLALTYRLMKIQQVVHRMQLVTELIRAILVDWKKRPATELFFEIILSEIRRFDLGRFVGQNVELLAFQITEHTGKAGEHYITRTRSEWGTMVRSAAIGGAIVAVMAVIKIVLSKLNMPPGPEAFAFGCLFAGGFLVIHWCGGTLATKQPAMTAASLASSLDEAPTSKQAMENLSEIIVRTIRSQMGAVLGNYIIAFPVATMLLLPFVMMKHPLMDPDKSWKTIESLNGLTSLSFWYAALTGIALFVSGLLAGFADNWFVFNNVGTRLKQSELLRKVVGPGNLDRAIHTIDHNLGFWVGSITLGFFLGTMSALGTITGLPIDSRHITFSSATFGAAMASLNFNVPVGMAVWVFISIFIMGLLNLGVSFTLSLFVAVKSRRIKFSQTPELLRHLGKRFLKRPLDFFLPLRDPP